MSIVYKIENTINGMLYIGQTRKLLEERFNEHITLSRRSSYHLHRAIKKYGIEHFTYSIIEEVDENNINEREMFWINEFDSFRCGYNMTLGGEGKKGYFSSEETKEKISKAKKGKLKSRLAYEKRNETLKSIDPEFFKTIGKKSSSTQKSNGKNAGKNNPKFDNHYYLLFNENNEQVLRYLRNDVDKLNPNEYPVRSMQTKKLRNTKLFYSFKEHKFKDWYFCYEHELGVCDDN